MERIGDTNSWDEKQLCEQTYRFKCADFGLKTLWSKDHSLTVVVYAWDTWEDAESDSNAQKRSVASNYIATLTYDFDKNGDKFTEKK